MEELFTVHGQQKCENRMWHPYTPSKGFKDVFYFSLVKNRLCEIINKQR